jgi:uncharacterized membrane protein YtjA (UPF0391 family)
MLRWAILFLIIAVVAGALGFGGLEGVAMQAAKLLCLVFVILFVVSLVMGRGRPPLP